MVNWRIYLNPHTAVSDQKFTILQFSDSSAGCEPQDLVLVQNVSTALNVILRSLPLKQDDVVFSLSIEYGKFSSSLDPVSPNISHKAVFNAPVAGCRWSEENGERSLQEYWSSRPRRASELSTCVRRTGQDGSELQSTLLVFLS